MYFTIKGIISLFITISLLIIINTLAFNANGEGEIIIKNTEAYQTTLVAQLEPAIPTEAVKEVTVPVTKPVEIVNPTPKAPTDVAKLPVNKPASVSIEHMKKRICEVFGSQCRNALVIAQHESSFNQFAHSRTNDFGVMQVNCRWHGAKVGGDCTRLYDLETNLRVAKQIYDASGWDAWATKKFL